ncbi:MAG: nucleotidyltransferase family protein [Bacteroidales bacterium]|nr:nucleotidyltransferase family protein [Bacteroidales bacterium]
MIEQTFFELIQVAIGTRSCLSHTPSADEWGELYAMAKKQSLVGVCFAGVQKLQAQRQEPPELLYLTWMGMAAKIQQRNEVVNRQCVEVQEKLSSDGLRSCVLKGQGVATLYGDMKLLRQSGDIDLWVPGDYKKTIDYVRLSQPECSVVANHIVWDLFADTEVEVHPIPAIFRNPLTNRRWKKFCKEHEKECMTNKVCLYDNDNTGICVPTTEFNLVFLMVHMYQHLLREGIGLRQFIDYYFVLRNFQQVSKLDKKGSAKNIKTIVDRIDKLGMKRFAAGLMDILHNVFGMPEELLLCEPDPEAGAELLSEIMTGGNFGHYDESNKVAFDNESNPIHRVWNGIKRNRRFLKYGFWEIAWSPIWRLWHFCWMKSNGYR